MTTDKIDESGAGAIMRRPSQDSTSPEGREKDAGAVPVYPGERIDDLQRAGLRIIQDPARFCFGMDAVLLSAYVQMKKARRGLDLGTGNGIIPILLSDRTDCASLTGLEIQAASADLAERSAALNGLGERIHIVRGDIREADRIFAAASFDFITCNPPYRQAGSGRISGTPAGGPRRQTPTDQKAAGESGTGNLHPQEPADRAIHGDGALPADAKRAEAPIRTGDAADAEGAEGPIRTGDAADAERAEALIRTGDIMDAEDRTRGLDPRAIARHEILCTFEDVARAASVLLRPGGHFYLVHRPLRLAEIIAGLCAHGLEPKRMRLVYPYVDKAPNMVLLDCVRGGAPELRVEPPLIVYEKNGAYTPELLRIYYGN